VQMEARVALQRITITGQGFAFAQQENAILGLQRNALALTRVFTWSTDTAGNDAESAPYTFTDGVRGRCFNNTRADKNYVGFSLDAGPVCTMHYKCSILDKDDKVLRVVSNPALGDLTKPPIETAPIGTGRGAAFSLVGADKAGVDGSVKFRVVVHLYLP